MTQQTHTKHRLRRTVATVSAGIAALALTGAASASPVGSVGVAPEGNAYVTNGVTGTISVRTPGWR